jgi:hypothetical protein
MNKRKAELAGSAFVFKVRDLDCSPATYEVHDDRDDRKDEEEMDEESCALKDQEAAEPKNYQDYSEN